MCESDGDEGSMTTQRTRYRVIASDPPWPYRDHLSMQDVKRSAGAHYKTMSPQQILHLGGFGTVAGFETFRDAFLFLWITNPFLLDGTGARVCRAWGFEPRQLITWVKGRVETKGKRTGQFIPQIGMGHMTRGATEHMILATRGAVKDQVKAKNVPNVFIAPRTAHSRKPPEAYALIERIAEGPYVELFARAPRERWLVWGNEVAA